MPARRCSASAPRPSTARGIPTRRRSSPRSASPARRAYACLGSYRSPPYPALPEPLPPKLGQPLTYPTDRRVALRPAFHLHVGPMGLAKRLRRERKYRIPGPGHVPNEVGHQRQHTRDCKRRDRTRHRRASRRRRGHFSGHVFILFIQPEHQNQPHGHRDHRPRWQFRQRRQRPARGTPPTHRTSQSQFPGSKTTSIAAPPSESMNISLYASDPVTIIHGTHAQRRRASAAAPANFPAESGNQSADGGRG